MEEIYLVDIGSFNIYALFLSLLFFAGFFLVFIYRHKKSLLELPILGISFTFLIVGYLSAGLFFLNQGEFPTMLDWGFLEFNFAIYFLGSHFESLYSPKPFITGRNAYTLVLFILSSLVYILHLAGLPEFQDISLNYQFTTLFAIGLFAFGIWIVNKARKVTKSTSIYIELLALFLILIASVLYALYFIVPYYTTITQERLTGLLIGGGLFSLCGILLYSIVIFRYHTIYHLPHPIYYILMYSGVGLPLYQRKIAQNPEIHLDEEELLPALLSAIDGFIQATLGVKEKLTSIEGDYFQIIFSPFYEENIVLCVITTQGSYYLDRAIKKFMKYLPRDFLLKANLNSETKEFRETIETSIRKYFPFLEI